jgi:hypothetical protein
MAAKTSRERRYDEGTFIASLLARQSPRLRDVATIISAKENTPMILFRARTFLAVLGLVLSCSAARGEDPPFRPMAIGLCEDYPSRTRTVANARRDLEACRRAGASVLRISFSWYEMEPEPGRYDFSFWDDVIPMAVDDFGLRLIPYVCYTPPWASAQPDSKTIWTTPPKDPAAFGRFVGKLVDRYKARLHSWELWNEPDIPEFWTGTPAEIAALVREGSRAVRAADPRAKVVLGGIARNPSYLRTLLRDYKVSPLVDIINAHAYFETWHEWPVEELMNYVGRLSDVIAEDGDGQELWLAEVGYSNYRPKDSKEVSEHYQARYAFEHTPEYQADVLLRSIVLARATDKVSLFTWYRVNDLPGSEEIIGDINTRHLGIVDLQGRDKPALEGFRRVAELLKGPLRVLDDHVQVTRPIAARAEVHVFEAPDGTVRVFDWQRVGGPGGRRDPAGRTDPRPAEEFTLFVPGRRLTLAPRAEGVVEVRAQEGGTLVRMSALQDHAQVVDLRPSR